jgi:hypothetical protein
MEHAGALDKVCLRRLKGVRRALGHGKLSSVSSLRVSYSSLAINE